MFRWLKTLIGLALILIIATFALRLIFPLPDVSNRAPEMALPADQPSSIATQINAMRPENRALSGVIALGNGADAFNSRLALIEAAEVAIDAQYYIWHDDVSGMLLLDALDRAAQRGVRVRLLVDDNGVPGMDDYLAALNQHNNFSIRLFNPSTVRRPKLFGYAFDFMRMNRRMHNKSLTVDNAVAIIGGRNIGDEYFQVQDDAFYLDMDVIGLGAVVTDTVEAFDQYWNANSVFQIETIIEGVGDRAAYDARVALMSSSDEASALRAQPANSIQALLNGSETPEWTNVTLVVDDPVKGEGETREDQLMIIRLGEVLGSIESHLDLASAYFVPAQRGTAFFNRVAESGARVRILTNAMDTTDVFLVHAGYSRYRRELLEGGVELYELKLRGGEPQEEQLFAFGLSGASLHAKSFAVDGNRIFIGSFNFDPRSARLNCEMGFLIESETLATRFSRGFDGPLRTVSYQPGLTPEGKMYWREERTMGQEVIYQEEPGASWFKQIAFAVIGLLPIEWLL